MNIQILCPGLFAPLAAEPLPPTPAIDRLLARADRFPSPHRDPLATLAAAFGLTAPAADAAGDLPTAALCLLAEAPDRAGEGCWFHADPVHLRADRDCLRLFAAPALAPDPDECAALTAAFNAHFAEDGLHLIAVGPGRWYLRVAQTPMMRTRPVYEAAGQVLDAYLPTGPDARGWNRWQNEAQMLFHGHPVNRARETAGRPAINGVWTWGGGCLPSVRGGPDLVVCDHPLGVGLARASGREVRGLGTLTGNPANWTAPGTVLIFWDGLWQPALLGDTDPWCGALSELESLIAHLSHELAAGRVRALTLDDGEHARFTQTPWGARRFWRRGSVLRDQLGRLPRGHD